MKANIRAFRVFRGPLSASLAFSGLVIATVVAAASATAGAQGSIPYSALAKRIVTSLAVERGERVLLRYDPATLGALEPEVKKQLEAKGAKVESLQYGPAPDLADRLARTDIYIWLPAGDK